MGCRAQLVLAAALILSGCVKEATVQPDTEVVIALKNVKDGWLHPCQGLGPRPGDDVGALKQDQADTAALAAECRDRHNSFVEYIGPVVQKLKQQQ
jgi:PBP1b-binding outer membrane lipoprotein LpoB